MRVTANRQAGLGWAGPRPRPPQRMRRSDDRQAGPRLLQPFQGRRIGSSALSSRPSIEQPAGAPRVDERHADEPQRPADVAGCRAAARPASAGRTPRARRRSRGHAPAATSSTHGPIQPTSTASDDDRVERDHQAPAPRAARAPRRGSPASSGRRASVSASILSMCLPNRTRRHEDRVRERDEPAPSSRDRARGDEERADDHQRAPDEEHAGLAEAVCLRRIGGAT